MLHFTRRVHMHVLHRKKSVRPKLLALVVSNSWENFACIVFIQCLLCLLCGFTVCFVNEASSTSFHICRLCQKTELYTAAKQIMIKVCVSKLFFTLESNSCKSIWHFTLLFKMFYCLIICGILFKMSKNNKILIEKLWVIMNRLLSKY